VLRDPYCLPQHPFYSLWHHLALSNNKSALIRAVFPNSDPAKWQQLDPSPAWASTTSHTLRQTEARHVLWTSWFDSKHHPGRDHRNHSCQSQKVPPHNDLRIPLIRVISGLPHLRRSNTELNDSKSEINRRYVLQERRGFEFFHRMVRQVFRQHIQYCAGQLGHGRLIHVYSVLPLQSYPSAKICGGCVRDTKKL
jgi:hypothetical protein